MRRILLFILLSIPFAMQAQQDVCSGALSLCATSTLNATTAGATVSGGDPALTCGDLTLNNNVWFKVLGTSAGSVTVTVSNIDNNPGLAMQVYTGACGSLTPLGPCNSANGPAGSMSITFATAAVTTYYIMVDGESGNGESFSITATSPTNSIVARPIATLIANPTNGCAPLNVALNDTSTIFGGTGITHQWRILPGGSYINSSGADTSIILQSAAVPYQVELRVCNAECGCNSTLQDVVVQNLVAAIGFSPANSCLNNPITFNGTASIEPSPPPVNPNVTSWQWNFGDPNSGVNNTANGQNVVHTFVGPGSSFTVRLIIDGICGPDTATQIITLNPRTRVSVNPPVLTVCQGSPINLVATTTNTTNPVTFLWTGAPTIVSPNSASTAITGLAPGPYVYTVHTVDGHACVADTTVNITVRIKPVVSAGSDDTVCVNTAVTLFGSVSAGIPPLTYTWTPSTGLSSSTILTPTATINATRTWCLKARDSFGCTSDSDCVTYSVYPRPTVSANPSFLCTSMNPPLQSTFTVSGLAPGSTYSWKLSPSYTRITSSLPDSSAVTATFPATVATYNFTITTFDPVTGCRDTLTTSISVVAGINMTAGTNRTICQGTSAPLTASNANTYLWTATPPYVFANPTLANQTVSPATTTTFVVRGTTGSCYEEDTVVITVRPKPVVNAGPDDTLCVNTAYTLNGSVSAGLPPLAYTWSPVTGLSSSTILNPTATISSTRTYCLTAIDTFGCISDTNCVTLSVYPLPSVSANPSTLCASLNPPLQSVFTVAGAGAGSTYRWRLSANYSLITGSNADSSVVTATFPPGVATTYTFRVIVFNPATGCRDTLNVAFTVTAGLAMTTTPSQSLCAGDSTTLTANGATTYLWTASPPYAFANPTQNSQKVKPTVTTTFIVRGTTGSCYDEDTVVVTLRPKPVVNAGPDDTICQNTPTLLNASVSAGLPPLSYIWSPAAGLSSSTVLNPTATISSTHTYCLQAGDTFACLSDTNCVTLYVYPLPSVSANPSTLCASINPPLQSVFTVSGAGPGSTYRWRFSANFPLITGSNADSSVVTATFPPGVATSYTFKVVVFNPVTGCSDTIPVAFTVTAGLNMSTTANLQLCAGDSTVLTANGATTYLWTSSPAYAFADPTSNTQNVKPAGTTTFFVTGTTGTCYDQDTVVVTMRPKPVVNAGPDDTTCSYTPTLINASVISGLPPFTYTWSPAAGLSSSTVLTPTASINSTRTYCLTARDSIGCTSDTNCVTLNVYPKPQINSPSVLCASQAPPFQATFDVTGAAAGSSYSWVLSPDYGLITSALPDSSTITATLPTGIAASYTFIAIVTDAVTGCRDTVSTSFTVDAGINITVTANSQVCPGVLVPLTASGAGGYSWTSVPPYPFADSTASTQNVTLTSTTTFYVTGTIGTCSDIDTIVVTVNPPPVASIAALGVFCRCDTVTLNGSASTVGAGYLWTSAAGNAILNPTLMNASAILCANDTLSLRVTDPMTLCTATATVVAVPRGAPSATASVSPSPICDGVLTLINLTGTADTAYSHSWSSIPAVSISDTAALITTASASGATVFYLTVSDTLGCDTTATDTLQVFPFPVISASFPYLCTSDPVLVSTVSVTGFGAGSTFVWDSIPPCVTPQTPSGPSQSFDFATCGLGAFRFVITVTDGVTGCVKTLAQTVTVVNGVALTLTPPQIICEGDSVPLVAGGANTFLWNTGSINDTLVVGDALPASATPYVYYVTGTIGSCTATDTVRVTVNPRPANTPITGPANVCENQPSVYTITTVPGVTYTWSVNGGTIASGQGTDTLHVNWGAAGPGLVSLADTNSFGCAGTPQSLNVTINVVPPQPTVTGTDTVCVNASASYSVPFTPGLTYSWTVTNGTIVGPSNTYSMNAQWSAAGTDSVILVVMNAANCSSDSGIFIVEVLPIPAPNAIAGNSLVCAADTNQLYVINDNPGSVYQWTVTGGTLVSGQANDSLVVNWDTVSTGTITLVETGANGCPGDTNRLNVTISRQPSASATPDSLSICRNQATSVSGTINTGTALWITSGTGTFDDSTSLTPVYTPGATDSGYIYLSLIASNAPCASDTDVVVLNISPSPVAGITSSSGGTICFGSTDTLIASGIGSYLWLPGSVPTDTLLAAPADTTVYTLIVTNSFACTDTATFTLNVDPAGIPTAGPDQWVCAGDSVFLSGSVQNAFGLQWITTGDGTFIPDSVTSPVTYIPGVADSANGSVDILFTTTGACLNPIDTVHLTITPYPVVFAGNDTTLSEPATLPLHGSVTGGAGIWYTTGTGVFNPNDTVLTGIYVPSQADYQLDSILVYLESTWSCITVIDSFVVKFFNFEVPNVFTPYPASPGYNDYFLIRGLKPGTALKIWDRWGLLVFETDNYRNDWDAAELKSDTYYYILSTPDKEVKGWVKVMREE